MATLILVTGSGRSGTSSLAGTLKRFGFVIPQPEVKADERNPRGYYEPSWTARFHGRWLKSLPVRTIDTRPDAGDIAMATATPERVALLRDWLGQELAALPDDAVVVVKETQAYWVYPLWQQVTGDLGIRLVSMTMLRHPAQVIRSRDAAWLSGMSAEKRAQREIANAAAWMNSIYVTERVTRTNDRAFIPYYDLIGDWRAAALRACAQVGVDPGDLSAPHDVDDFITTSLNRSAASWDGLVVPQQLRDAADATWTAVNELVAEPHDGSARSTLDRLRHDYAEQYVLATAIASDQVQSEVAAAKRVLQERLDAKNERLTQLRERLRAVEGGRGDSRRP